MARPVTAQRTKSPGVNTCTSPSRYLSLASPLKPRVRSKRFITPRGSIPMSSSYHSVGFRVAPDRLQQCALVSAVARAPSRARRGFAAAGRDFRRDMAVGEFEVERLARRDLGGAADHAALGAADKGEA